MDLRSIQRTVRQWINEQYFDRRPEWHGDKFDLFKCTIIERCRRNVGSLNNTTKATASFAIWNACSSSPSYRCCRRIIRHSLGCSGDATLSTMLLRVLYQHSRNLHVSLPLSGSSYVFFCIISLQYSAYILSVVYFLYFSLFIHWLIYLAVDNCYSAAQTFRTVYFSIIVFIIVSFIFPFFRCCS